jgi:hypothetical protein
MARNDSIDPTEYRTEAAFKQAFYDRNGPGTWLDDAKLKVLYLDAHDEEIPDYLDPLLKA